jgi:hypothetical protein
MKRWLFVGLEKAKAEVPLITQEKAGLTAD